MSARRPPRETGAALLTVLILVGVIGALAAGLFDRLRLATHLASNAGGQALARSIAASAETLLVARLAAPAGAAGTRLSLPLPGGTAAAELTEGGNCFNLNSLVIGPADRSRVSPAGLTQFRRLLAAAGIADATAGRVAAATADWIDSDDLALPEGGEDALYARASPAYRTAGTYMAEVSEWRAVAGVTPAVYAAARPWLCALPTAEPAAINVNTLAPADAPVLAALIGRPVAVAQALLAERPAGGWRDAAAFWNSHTLADRPAATDALGQARTTSSWYRATITVAGVGAGFVETALIDARRQPARLVARRWTGEE